MNTKTNAGIAFNNAFATATTIPFSQDWENGTGYFDDAAEGVNAPQLQNGKVAASTDQYGRRLLIIGLTQGNLVIFDRFKNQTEGGVYVFNAPRMSGVETELGGSSLNGEQMQHALSLIH